MSFISMHVFPANILSKLTNFNTFICVSFVCIGNRGLKGTFGLPGSLGDHGLPGVHGEQGPPGPPGLGGCPLPKFNDTKLSRRMREIGHIISTTTRMYNAFGFENQMSAEEFYDYILKKAAIKNDAVPNNLHNKNMNENRVTRSTEPSTACSGVLMKPGPKGNKGLPGVANDPGMMGESGIPGKL